MGDEEQDGVANVEVREEPASEVVEAPKTDFMDMTAEEAVAFDFFNDEKPEKSPGEKLASEGSDPEPPKPKEPGEPEPAPEPKPEPEPAPAPVQAQDTRDAEIAELRRQNQLLTEAVSRPAQPVPQAAPAGPQPIFGLQVPDELVEAMGHEDPRIRRNAVQTLINGALDIAYRKTQQDVVNYVDQRLNSGIQQHAAVTQQQNAVATDFYGTYPEFNKPELRKVVMTVAEDVATELGARAWTPQLRDALGTRLRRMFNVQQPTPAPHPSPPQTRRATPRAINPGTRPSPPNSGENSLVEFLGLDSL